MSKPFAVLMIVSAVVCAGSLLRAQDPERAEPSPSKGQAALESAAKAGKYLFVFFHKKSDEHTARMEEVFSTVMAKVVSRANAVRIDVKDRKERAIVEKFGVRGAPMPLVLALAPNGAITRGFPYRFDEKQLLQAFVSPALEKTLKALQENKYVVLCVLNDRTRAAKAVMKEARAFRADKQYAKNSVIVTLDPLDRAEAKTLEGLNIDPKSTQAVTVLMAPPGKVAARFNGALKKGALAAALKKSCCTSG